MNNTYISDYQLEYLSLVTLASTVVPPSLTTQCYYRLTCNVHLLVYLHTSTLLVYISSFMKFTQPLYMFTIEPFIVIVPPNIEGSSVRSHEPLVTLI